MVQAREDDEYLQKLLSYYKEITGAIQKSGHLRDSLQISILAGITLVDELYKAKTHSLAQDMERDKSSEEEAQRLTMQMIEQIDRVLK